MWIIVSNNKYKWFACAVKNVRFDFIKQRALIVFNTPSICGRVYFVHRQSCQSYSVRTLSSSAFLYRRHINEFECIIKRKWVHFCCSFVCFLRLSFVVVSIDGVNWRKCQRNRNSKINAIHCKSFVFFWLVDRCVCYNVYMTLTKSIACIILLLSPSSISLSLSLSLLNNLVHINTIYHNQQNEQILRHKWKVLGAIILV